MAYHSTRLCPCVSTLFHRPLTTGHRARRQALPLFLQGFRRFKHASLSGMGRGGAVLYEDNSFRGQRKTAHRLLKHDQLDPWATGAARCAHRPHALPQVPLAVAWTALGACRGLEACLIVEGRGLPVASILVHNDAVTHRHTRGEWTRW